MQQLRNKGYVDRQTRAVFVDVALYNPGVDLFTSVHLTFEFLPGGALVRTGETDSQPLLADLRALAGDDGYSRRQQAQVVIELLSYLAIVGYFLLRAADEVVGYAGFLTYLCSGWNALDALSILCLLAVIVIMCHVRIVSLNHWKLTVAPLFDEVMGLRIAWMLRASTLSYTAGEVCQSNPTQPTQPNPTQPNPTQPNPT